MPGATLMPVSDQDVVPVCAPEATPCQAAALAAQALARPEACTKAWATAAASNADWLYVQPCSKAQYLQSYTQMKLDARYQGR